MAMASAEQVSNKIMPHIKRWFKNNKNSEKTIKLIKAFLEQKNTSKILYQILLMNLVFKSCCRCLIF